MFPGTPQLVAGRHWQHQCVVPITDRTLNWLCFTNLHSLRIPFMLLSQQLCSFGSGNNPQHLHTFAVMQIVACNFDGQAGIAPAGSTELQQ